MNFIDLQKQYQHLQKKIDRRIHNVLSHGKYIMGPEVTELEEKLANFAGVKHAITCANGTDALQLSLMALNIKAGDAVFTTPFTFFATAEVISLVGATPIFVDVDPRTFNIDPQALETSIVKIQKAGRLAPKAIIAVDLFGLPANYPELEVIAKKHQLQLIEDAAQGFGGSINNQRAGSFGNIATTSFFPAKPLGCYGDGGAVFTNSDQTAEQLKSLRIHGKGSDKYDNVRIGMNSRLDTIQAAILLEKLDEFSDELVKRNAVAKQYTSLLKDQFITPFVPSQYFSSWAQYTLVSNDRDGYIVKLKEKGIPAMVYYAKPLHLQSAFSYLKKEIGSFPIAESLAEQVFSLPMHPYLSESEIKAICNELNN